MELYRQYLLERENTHLLDYDWGFATYSFGDNHVYLQDIYVVPEKRDAGLGVHLMNEVGRLAKEQGHEVMIGSVDDRGEGSKNMHEIMKHLGFIKYSEENTTSYYIKEI